MPPNENAAKKNAKNLSERINASSMTKAANDFVNFKFGTHQQNLMLQCMLCECTQIEASQRAIARKASNYYCERAIQSTHDFRSVFEKLLEENGEFGKKIFMNANSERYQVR